MANERVYSIYLESSKGKVKDKDLTPWPRSVKDGIDPFTLIFKISYKLLISDFAYNSAFSGYQPT